jgi:hypothetical protein
MTERDKSCEMVGRQVFFLAQSSALIAYLLNLNL